METPFLFHAALSSVPGTPNHDNDGGAWFPVTPASPVYCQEYMNAYNAQQNHHLGTVDVNVHQLGTEEGLPMYMEGQFSNEQNTHITPYQTNKAATSLVQEGQFSEGQNMRITRSQSQNRAASLVQDAFKSNLPKNGESYASVFFANISPSSGSDTNMLDSANASVSAASMISSANVSPSRGSGFSMTSSPNVSLSRQSDVSMFDSTNAAASPGPSAASILTSTNASASARPSADALQLMPPPAPAFGLRLVSTCLSCTALPAPM
jgi:hypothetical protein